MKKYGDLSLKNRGEKNCLQTKLEEVLEVCLDKSYEVIWKDFIDKIGYQSDCKIISKDRFEKFNADVLYTENMVMPLYNFISSNQQYMDLPAWATYEEFDKNITYYEENIDVLKEDVQRCVYYNLSCDRRSHKINLRAEKWIRYSTSLSTLEERAEEYSLPFEFCDNLYGDFCSYVWTALLKDAYSLDLFRKSERDNANKTSALKVLNSFALAPEYDALEAEITSNDIWLVEKIIGNGLAHSIVSLAKGIEKGVLDSDNLKKYIYPLLKELVRCKPIKVRLAVSDLVVKVINDLLVWDNKYVTDITTNSVLDKNKITELVNRVKKSVNIINHNFENIVGALYDFYRKENQYVCYFEEGMEKDMPVISGEVVFVEDQWDGMKEELENWNRKMFNVQNYEKILFINQKGSKNDLAAFRVKKKSYKLDDVERLFADIQQFIIQEIHKQYCEEISS